MATKLPDPPGPPAENVFHFPDKEPLRGGPGGPYDPLMEQRVANLENDMREVKKDLTDIKVLLAEIKTELNHKISYKWLSLYVVGLAALILRAEIATLFNSTP